MRLIAYIGIISNLRNQDVALGCGRDVGLSNIEVSTAWTHRVLANLQIE